VTTESYYGRSIVKEPVWKSEIPLYFWTGGIAGASAVLHGVARLTGNEALAKRALYIGAVADVASPLLLVKDLGRPERFLNMFRMFKVTSPMSVGSWVLFASGGATTTHAACEVLGILPRFKAFATGVSALFGAPLAVYTATLISDTAVPVWHEARRELPFVFAGSSAASAGAACALIAPPRSARPARRLAIAGAALELTAASVMERRLGFLAEPYRRGRAGTLSTAAKALTAAGALTMLLQGRRRGGAVGAGALLLAGSLAERLAIFRAGLDSARDPRYTVVPQRQRVDQRAATAA